MSKRRANQPSREFVAVPGSRLSDDDAKRIGPELERLLSRCGGQTSAVEVLTAARDPSSPFHGHICWDAARAAENWQLHEANNLLRSIAIREVYPDGRQTTRPLLVSVQISAVGNVTCATRETTQRIYVEAVKVAAQPELAERILERALSDLKSWRRHYSMRAEIAGAFVERFQPVLEALDAMTGEGDAEAAA